MNVALHRPMTREEFFDWAEAQDGPHEFDGLQPVAMTGGNAVHGILSSNLIHQLVARLGEGRCQAMPAEGAGVATSGDVVRYPEAVVTCSEMSGLERLVPEPVVVFEVLSPTSRHVDLVVKPVEYGSVPSIRCYVVIEQARVALRVYRRGPDGAWSETRPLGPGETLQLPEIGIELPLADLYKRVPRLDERA